MKKIFAVMLCAVLLAGCAGQKFSPKHREQIKTVKVLPVKWEPGEIHYFGRAQNTGMAFGGYLGFLLANSLSTSPQREIIKTLDSEKIDLGALVKQHFVAELAKNPSLNVVGDEATADAHIQLTVDYWGFQISHGFSGVIYPVIKVGAVMQRGTERLWVQNEGVTPFTDGNDLGYVPASLGTEPETLRLALNGVSAIASQSLAKGLR
jgi:hypothetical protein